MRPEHPAAEMLERFALRRLPANSIMEILRHLDECSACRTAVAEEYEFIEAMREALRRRASRPG